jgi:hypothetical protein
VGAVGKMKVTELRCEISFCRVAYQHCCWTCFKADQIMNIVGAQENMYDI